MRFAKFICFYGKLADALVCRGCSRDAFALLNSFAFTGDVRTHFAYRLHADAHAGCMQIPRGDANSFAFIGNVRTQFANIFHADVHAGCMQTSRVV